MEKGTLNQIIKSFSLLSIDDKTHLILLIILSLINSLIQTVGIVSIMPFIAIVSDPSLVDSNRYIIMIKDWLNVQSFQSLLMIFGGFTFISLVASNFFSIFTSWANLRFFNHKEHQLTKELLNIYLSKKTPSFYNVKKSQILKYIISDVERVLVGSQLTLIELLSDVVVCIIVISLLLYIDPQTTIITALALSLAYLLIFVLLAEKIKTYGSNFSLLESKVYASINHAIDMFREIRISGKKSYFINKYSVPSESLADQAVKYYIISYLPLQLVEILAFGIIITIAIYYSVADQSVVNTITSISIFAFATYRLVPILKAIFSSFEELAYNKTLLSELLLQFKNRETDATEHSANSNTSKKIHLKKVISLNDITYQYSPDLPLILKNFNLQIERGKFTCISGKSGAGKSTLLDIILGLTTPTSGKILIDDTLLDKNNLRKWQNNIGYVPQKNQFVDGTVYQNIAFGIEKEKVDMDRVKEVAKLAHINELIEQHLPDKYESLLGDGGITLSGGERQRIGIARSLYHDPQILVFDEATNELDPETEASILSNIKELKIGRAHV